MKKRIFSLLLALMMVLGIVPAVSAEEAPTSGTCGENVTWTLDDSGTLTISGTGEMTDFNSEDAPWYSRCDAITAVMIENGVSSIGASAFYGCKNLTSVTIPDSVTTIGLFAFANCSGLTSIVIPDGISTIFEYTFAGCSNLNSIVIPDSVITIDAFAFVECDSLTSIAIPDSVTTICGYAFASCDSLTSIVIPDSVATIESFAFWDCTSLTSVTIPDSVTSIEGWVFWGCSSLPSITIPNSVTTIYDYAFRGCSSLTSIVIPDSVTSIGECPFFECSSLTEVVFQGDAPSIDEYCFSGINTTAYYPADNATWTDDVMQDYNGTITWVPYTPAPKVSFTDVPASAWFADQVEWAVANDITNGMTVTTFAPDNTCTRNQVVTFLWRAEGSPEPESTDSPFVDVKESDYFYKAVLWAVENGITTGMDKTHFAPNSECTRAQVVTFLHRAAEKPAPASTENPFSDVKEDFYTDAVLWAVGEEITTGITTDTFEPDSTCTRAQIVTFLYRYKN